MKEYIPYCYLIGWSKLDRWYYGVEHGCVSKVANPENLWNSYFTSSEIVTRFRIENGEPDVVQVRKTFLTENAATEWEGKVLKRMKVVSSPKWLNAHDKKNFSGKSLRGRSYEQIMGVEKAAELKQIRSESTRGKDNSNEKNPMFGKTHSAETRALQSKLQQGENHSMFGWNWVKNSTHSVKIHPSKLAEYLELGYTLGRHKVWNSKKVKGKRWLNNSTIEKLVEPSLIANYLSNGFTFGRL